MALSQNTLRNMLPFHQYIVLQTTEIYWEYFQYLLACHNTVMKMCSYNSTTDILWVIKYFADIFQGFQSSGTWQNEGTLRRMKLIRLSLEVIWVYSQCTYNVLAAVCEICMKEWIVISYSIQILLESTEGRLVPLMVIICGNTSFWRVRESLCKDWGKVLSPPPPIMVPPSMPQKIRRKVNLRFIIFPLYQVV